jgi:hypothetical protein
MSDKPRILIQLDPDPQPSAFDRVVAVDAGADHVFAYGGVTPEQVRGLVHGAIFTRSPKDLHRTAVFVGGSDVAAAETLFAEVRKHLLPQFGLRVSALLDPSGANTTAAAAVRAATRHLELAQTTALVLGGTGPVGQRAARLLARQGATVRIGSRQRPRAEAVAVAIRAVVPDAKVLGIGLQFEIDAPAAFANVNLVVAAGAEGVVLLPRKIRQYCTALKVAIDLNAVPPLGVEGVEVTDRGTERDGVIGYGALGVGDTKMKVHKAAIGKLFEANDRLMDAEEVYELAQAF